MRVRIIVATVALLGALTLDGRSQVPPPPPAISVQHVNVVDVANGQLLTDQTVVVADGRITSIRPANSAETPSGATLVDGQGKYLIPGLWDMHVHAAWPGIDQPFAPLFIANGVTGVREMYGDMGSIKAWKSKYEAREPWPRIVGAGHILDGPKPFWPGSTSATTAEEARRAVDSLHAAGADFIKIYNGLPHDAYVAAVDEAKKVGTYVVGHVPYEVTVAEVSDLGQRSMEHLNGVSLECSRDADSLSAERIEETRKPEPNIMGLFMRQAPHILATQDSARFADLCARLVRNHTWQVPTLVVLRSISWLNDEAFTTDDRVAYMPAEVVTSWSWKNDPRFASRSPEDWAISQQLFRRSLEVVGELHRAGVSFLAGTDVLNPYCFPGFSLHDELGLLVVAGLSQAEALRAATLNPAIFLGMTDSLGTVEEGKRADLVLLDLNPLEKIRNSQTIRAVIVNGRLYDRAALDALLAAAKDGAGATH